MTGWQIWANHFDFMLNVQNRFVGLHSPFSEDVTHHYQNMFNKVAIDVNLKIYLQLLITNSTY